jgi:hypothetical protein
LALRGFPKLEPDQFIGGKEARSKEASHQRSGHPRERRMLDIIMLAIGLGFFALSVGYTMACDQL